MTFKRHLLLMLSFVTFMASCGAGPQQGNPDTGQVADGVYVNEYFSVKVSVPEGWHVVSKESEEYIRDVGGNIVAGDDAALKAQMEAAQKNVFNLLSVSEFEMGAVVEFNPTFFLVAERVSHLPGLKDGADYLLHSEELLLGSQLPYQLAEGPYPVELGGRQWHRADFFINLPRMRLSQSYVAVKQGDFVLSMVLTAATAEQKAVLEKAASSIVFGKVP